MKEKKEYFKPRLKSYGSLNKITKASGSLCPKDHPINAGTRVC